MVTHWKPDLTELHHASESSSRYARELFERGTASAENPVEFAHREGPLWMSGVERLGWAVATQLRQATGWAAYYNAGWCSSSQVPLAVLEDCADSDPTVILAAAGIPPHLTDRAARKVLEAAKYVRLRRILELYERGDSGPEPTGAQRGLLDSFDSDQPWFVASDEDPRIVGYALMFEKDNTVEMLWNQIQAIDEFLNPTSLPEGYVSRVIQLKQGLIARAFVPGGSAWAPALGPEDGEFSWDTSSVDRPVCVVARPLGLTDGTVGLDRPAEGVPAVLRRWGSEGMVVEALPLWGEHSWRSADREITGPMVDAQADALAELAVLLRIYANPREATLIGMDSARYLAIRHAHRGGLFEPTLLAGSPISNDLVAARATWALAQGLRTPVHDLSGAPADVNRLLSVPFAAHRVPSPPMTRLTGRPDMWNPTGDRDIDNAIGRGREILSGIVLRDPEVRTHDDLIRKLHELSGAFEAPVSVKDYATAVGFYLYAPSELRERADLLLLEPTDAQRQTLRALNALNPARLQIDPARIEQFLKPDGVEDEDLARLLVVDFDPVRGTGVRLWRSLASESPSRVFVGVPDPGDPGREERMGAVSPTLRGLLRAHPEVAILESWNEPTSVNTSLPRSLFYAHTHLGRPERVFAEGSAAPIARQVYPAETLAAASPWEDGVRRYLGLLSGRPATPRSRTAIPGVPVRDDDAKRAR